ncbi:MAG: GGDEF domain-containing protein [Acidobacteriia bacterium]|nr:GGDEF domain-containing protein [Terriglobia bacterium]
MTEANRFFKDLLDNLYDGVYFVDCEKKITYWNRGAERITGYMKAEVVGRSCAENMLRHVDDFGNLLCLAGCPLGKTIQDGEMREAAIYLHHKMGHRVPVQVRVTPLHDADGKVVGAIEVFSENSFRVAANQRIVELEKVAFLDPLTGVGNRRYTEMILEGRLNELQRYGWPFAVLFFDIDNFKQVNDTYGHDMGDQVLKVISRTLLTNLRSFDFIGRWGGEEFFGIVVNVKEDQLFGIANKFRFLVEHSSIPVGKKMLRVTVSIGATLARREDTVVTLVKRADELLYKSKTGGRNRISI